MGPSGEYKVASLSTRNPGQLLYAATIPRDIVARVLVDTRLRVTDASSGLTLRKGDAPSAVLVTAGPAKVQVRLAVALVDQDLSSQSGKPKTVN